MNRPWSGSLVYALQASERRASTTAAWRPFDFDQTHSLVALASWAPGAGWTFSARLRASSGLPRTPVTSAYFDSVSATSQPVFGAQGSARLPPFFQLDLHADKVLTLGPVRLAAYLEVLNVTWHPNVEEYVYSPDYRERRALTGLPLLAVLGLKVEL